MRHLIIAAALVAGSLLAVQTLVVLLEHAASSRQEAVLSEVLPTVAVVASQPAPTSLKLPMRQQQTAAAAAPPIRLSAR
jgi:hypothetical protein